MHEEQEERRAVWVTAVMRALCIACGAWSLAAAQGLPMEDWIYQVKPGDNPWNLTERFLDGMKYWPRVQSHNNITDPLHIPIGTALRIPVPWIRTAPANAVVTAARPGGCRWTGESGALRNLGQGDPISAGALLSTPADGFCSVRFPDGSRMLLLPQSELRVEKLLAYALTGMFDIRATLLKGRAEITAKPLAGPASRFEISSPQGVTSVRGTQYRTASLSENARVEVLEGQVAVSNPIGSQLLNEGTGSVFSATEAPSPPLPLLSAPDMTGMDTLIRRQPHTLRFAPVPQAQSYRALWATDASFNVLLGEQRAEAAEITLTDLRDGDYALKLRAIDGRELEGKESIAMLKVDLALPAPQSCAVVEGSEFARPEVTLRCAPVPRAAKYRFQVAGEESFKHITQDIVQGEPSVRLRVDSPGVYHWRVAAMDQNAKLGEYSDAARMLRFEPAPEVSLQEFTRDAMTFSWTPFLRGKQYRLEVATDSAMQNTLYSVTTIGDRLVVPRPSAGHYYVRVGVVSAPEEPVRYGTARTLNVPPLGPLEWLAPTALLFLFAL